MAYAFESQLVIDPVSGDKAASASVTVYDANDTANSAPLALTDLNGNPLSNPLTSTPEAFIPPFMAETYKVKLVGGGLTVVAWSGEGLVNEANAAKQFVQGISVLSTATAPAGTSAAVSIDSTGKFSFTIPKGTPGKDGANVLPTDDAIKQAINDPTSATRGALDPQFAGQKESFMRARMVRQGRDDSIFSLAQSQRQYQSVGEFIETWADTTRWNTGGVVFPVSGGKLYGTTDVNATISIPVATGDGRYRTRLGTVAGGTERFQFAGFSQAAPGLRGGAGDHIGVGIHYAQAGTNYKVIVWDRGAETIVADYTPGDVFNITAGFDAGQVWVELTDSTGVTKVATVQVDRAGFDLQQFVLYADDDRGTTGDWFDRVTGRDGSVTSTDRTHEVAAPSAASTVAGGTNVRVQVPADYDSRRPSPLVIFCHGYGGNARAGVNGSGTDLYKVFSTLLANGFIVASSDATGGDEVGTGYLAYRDLYRHVRDRYATGPVIVASESFGGVSAARLLSDPTTIPDIAGWVAWYPVTNLANVYADNSTLASSIDAKYGSLKAAQDAGADPALIPATGFRGVPFRAYHSDNDLTVRKADTLALAARIGPYTTENVVYNTSGGHGDPSNFQPSDTLAFINRCLGR